MSVDASSGRSMVDDHEDHICYCQLHPAQHDIFSRKHSLRLDHGKYDPRQRRSPHTYFNPNGLRQHRPDRSTGRFPYRTRHGCPYCNRLEPGSFHGHRYNPCIRHPSFLACTQEMARKERPLLYASFHRPRRIRRPVCDRQVL